MKNLFVFTLLFSSLAAFGINQQIVVKAMQPGHVCDAISRNVVELQQNGLTNLQMQCSYRGGLSISAVDTMVTVTGMPNFKDCYSSNVVKLINLSVRFSAAKEVGEVMRKSGLRVISYSQGDDHYQNNSSPDLLVIGIPICLK